MTGVGCSLGGACDHDDRYSRDVVQQAVFADDAVAPPMTCVPLADGTDTRDVVRITGTAGQVVRVRVKLFRPEIRINDCTNLKLPAGDDPRWCASTTGSAIGPRVTDPVCVIVSAAGSGGEFLGSTNLGSGVEEWRVKVIKTGPMLIAYDPSRCTVTPDPEWLAPRKIGEVEAR